MRPAVLALVVSGVAAAACSPPNEATCPGNLVAVFHFKGSLVRVGDPRIAGFDPVPAEVPDCTPDPFDPDAPIRYPEHVALDAKLASDPATSAAALCRGNGVVYSGVKTGDAGYDVSAEANPALLCGDVCAADLRVEIAGDVTGTSGAPAAFDGILVEVLTASRGACGACLPALAGTDPPELTCAARYALTGWTY